MVCVFSFRIVKYTWMLMASLEVDQLAAFLRGKGIRPGDFVGVFMSNSPEMVMAILALQKLGAVAALLNINLRGL